MTFIKRPFDIINPVFINIRLPLSEKKKKHTTNYKT